MRTKHRVRNIGEVFTAKREVKAMLDLVGSDIASPQKTILEPACGNGNFLMEILARRLNYIADKAYKRKGDYERNILVAISNMYGIDIMDDNVDDCKQRLYAEIMNQYNLTRNTENPSKSFVGSVKEILATNIILGDSQNGKRYVNFIKYTITSNGVVRRSQYNLERLELGDTTPILEFEPAHISSLPSIHPQILNYYNGDQINLFVDPERAV